MSQRTLAAEFGYTEPAVSALVRELVERNAVAVTAVDGRERSLSLTSGGAASSGRPTPSSTRCSPRLSRLQEWTLPSSGSSCSFSTRGWEMDGETAHALAPFTAMLQGS
jgi:hypothetical protein